jgi:hypothetical protein
VLSVSTHAGGSSMMFLYNGMGAEVEPVPGKPGWFQLTGRHIERWTMPMEEALPEMGVTEEDMKAKIVGIHDMDPEIAERDPRFNWENNEDNASFAVIKQRDGTYRMFLAVNQAEYVLFRFLAPHESVDDDEYDPMSNYRIEAPAPKKRAKAKASAKAAA